MPDSVAKYLNKTGLETYNESMPHSPAQMQEYVNDWLDEHPEATTTVQPNSITNDLLVQTGGVLSEVHDIRTGVDDTTYASAGDAVRSIERGLDSATEPKNLFDMHSPDTTFGKYYGADGTLVANSQYGSSQLIAVEAERKYTAEYKGLVIWYDSNGSYLTSTTRSAHETQGYVTPPANASFARFTYQTATVDNFWVHSDNPTDITTPKIPVMLTDTTFSEPKNLFDKDADNDLTGYYNTSGVHQSSSTIGQTDYVPVVQGYFYTTPIRNVFVLWYDSNKELIGSTNSTQFTFWDKVRPIPDAAYAKFLFYIADIATFYIHSDRPEDQQINAAYLPATIAEARAFNGITWVSFGDSITARNKWQPYVIEQLGMEHQNCGIGSTPLSGDNENAFWRDVRLNAVKAYNPDIVTILGGANDLVLNQAIGTETNLTDRDTSTFIGAYSYIINNLLTWKPSLRIFILSTTWAHNDGAAYSQTVTYGQFAEACKLVANYYKLPFVDLYNNSGFNSYTMGNAPNNIYSADNIHPNEAGGKIIANQVIEKIYEVMRFH